MNERRFQVSVAWPLMLIASALIWIVAELVLFGCAPEARRAEPTDSQCDAACFAMSEELQLSRRQVRKILRAVRDA